MCSAKRNACFRWRIWPSSLATAGRKQHGTNLSHFFLYPFLYSDIPQRIPPNRTSSGFPLAEHVPDVGGHSGGYDGCYRKLLPNGGGTSAPPTSPIANHLEIVHCHQLLQQQQQHHGYITPTTEEERVVLGVLRLCSSREVSAGTGKNQPSTNVQIKIYTRCFLNGLVENFDKPIIYRSFDKSFSRNVYSSRQPFCYHIRRFRMIFFFRLGENVSKCFRSPEHARL